MRSYAPLYVHPLPPNPKQQFLPQYMYAVYSFTVYCSLVQSYIDKLKSYIHRWAYIHRKYLIFNFCMHLNLSYIHLTTDYNSPYFTDYKPVYTCFHHASLQSRLGLNSSAQTTGVAQESAHHVLSDKSECYHHESITTHFSSPAPSFCRFRLCDVTLCREENLKL